MTGEGRLAQWVRRVRAAMDDPRRTGLFLVAVVHVAMAGTVRYDIINHDHALLFQYIPAPARIVMWLVAAGFALSGALSPRTQTLGYAVAVAMPVERAVSHLWSWLAYVLPGPAAGDPVGLWWALVWASGAAMISVVAGASAPTPTAGQDDATG